MAASPLRQRVSTPTLRFGVALALALASACSPSDVARTLGAGDPTPHEQYAKRLRDAGLEETALGREWLVAADSALRSPLVVTLPFHEEGYYSRTEARAVAYRLTLVDGQRLVASLTAHGLPARVFVDLFEEQGDSVKEFSHRAHGEPQDSTPATRTAAAGDTTIAAQVTLVHEARRNGTYIVRVQPELLRSGRFSLTLRIEPQLAFPVAGHGNRAVWSVFGDERDAGSRVHHGIDIFAPRGTPVVAATTGRVRSTTPNNLGGNVVWLHDDARGQVLYYAHLDRHIVSPGDRVDRGDTLGFVGNSGNARGTKPHLHFGIYRRGEGPIDPFPFVRVVTTRPAPLVADTGRLGEIGRVVAATTPVLRAPIARADTVRRVQRNTEVQIVGATGAYYRVQLENGMAGYLPARVTMRVASPAGNGRSSGEGR